MVEPQLQTGRQHTVPASGGWRALAKKPIPIWVHPAGLQFPLLPPHILPLMTSEFLMSSPAPQGIPQYRWCMKNMESRRFLGLNYVSAAYYFITLNKFLSTLCALVLRPKCGVIKTNLPHRYVAIINDCLEHNITTLMLSVIIITPLGLYPIF